MDYYVITGKIKKAATNLKIKSSHKHIFMYISAVPEGASSCLKTLHNTTLRHLIDNSET